MLDVLKFILSDFWTFCGTVVLIEVSGTAVAKILAAMFGKVWIRQETQTDNKEMNKADDFEQDCQ